MLIEFRVGNFLSFKDVVTFSMVASLAKEHRDTHVFKVDNSLSLLKCSAVYGANASGKSNLFKAMDFMQKFINDSAKNMQAGEKINIQPFRLSTETENKPSFFEISFIHENAKYRYGFEVDASKVVSEWLYYTPNKREIDLFTREGSHFKLGSHFKEGEGLQAKTRINALFLSVVAQFNGKISIKILEWFSDFNRISGLDNLLAGISASLVVENIFKDTLMDFLRFADAGIEELEHHNEDPYFYTHDPADINRLILFDDIYTLHKKYDENKAIVSLEQFTFLSDESEGTKKLFSIIGVIILSLNHGGILVIDELDSSLHPLITQFIIKLFNSNNKNIANAQLIFNTHDTNLLNNKLLRRDQVWFTEKDRYGATDLYSLIDYRVRNDASFEKDYISGKYGAIPFIGDLQFN